VSLVIELYPRGCNYNLLGSNPTGDSTDNNKPVQKRKLNSNSSTQIGTNNNIHNNGIFQRHDLDKEIDRFIPLVKDILEGEHIRSGKRAIVIQ
jgi:hypothetical protein